MVWSSGAEHGSSALHSGSEPALRTLLFVTLSPEEQESRCEYGHECRHEYYTLYAGRLTPVVGRRLVIGCGLDGLVTHRERPVVFDQREIRKAGRLGGDANLVVGRGDDLRLQDRPAVVGMPQHH